MTHPPLLLSQVNVDEVNVPWQSPSGATREFLLVLGAFVLVTAVLLVWARYFRKRRRHHSHHHHHHHHSSSEQSVASGTDMSASAQEPHKRRRRRREHRPRNPTLAETGGLPPLRSDPPSEPLP
jgi:hypothetical protein